MVPCQNFDPTCQHPVLCVKNKFKIMSFCVHILIIYQSYKNLQSGDKMPNAKVAFTTRSQDFKACSCEDGYLLTFCGHGSVIGQANYCQLSPLRDD